MVIHGIKEQSPTNKDLITTFCGKIGYYTGWPHEYDTAQCNRFEATDNRSRVDCKKCRSSMRKQD